jgi:nucleoid-associated protein YgaU
MALYDALSRYRLDASGQTASRLEAPRRGYTTYVVQQGDTLEGLAFRHLGSAKRYWELADLNPQVKFPLDLEVGMLLRMPT